MMRFPAADGVFDFGFASVSSPTHSAVCVRALPDTVAGL